MTLMQCDVSCEVQTRVLINLELNYFIINQVFLFVFGLFLLSQQTLCVIQMKSNQFKSRFYILE